MAMSLRNQNIVKNMYMLLKYTYGLLFVVAGADKFYNLTTYWPQYVSPFVLQSLKVPVSTFIMIVGIIEIIIGLLILTKMTRIGAYAAMGWLLLIVINLLSMKTYYDVAVRDVVLAIGAFVLAQLTDVHDELS